MWYRKIGISLFGLLLLAQDADAKSLKGKVGLWLLSGSRTDIAGQLWDAHVPLAEVPRIDKLADYLSVAPKSRFVLDGVYGDQDAEYRDECALADIVPLDANEVERIRMVVRVRPSAGETARVGDERPAEVALHFPELLGALGKGRLLDLTMLSVQCLDPNTMTPVPAVRFAYGATPFDIPWRWYDASIGYDFPDNSENLDVNEGKLSFHSIPRFGYFYDCIGDWREGRLAFAHRDLETGRMTEPTISWSVRGRTCSSTKTEARLGSRVSRPMEKPCQFDGAPPRSP